MRFYLSVTADGSISAGVFAGLPILIYKNCQIIICISLRNPAFRWCVWQLVKSKLKFELIKELSVKFEKSSLVHRILLSTR